MTDRDFVYWLNGYFELTKADDGLTKEQVKVIKDHLFLLFQHVIPYSAGNDYSSSAGNSPYPPSFTNSSGYSCGVPPVKTETAQANYDDQPDDFGHEVLHAVNKLLKDKGLEVEMTDDGLLHDGYMIFELKLKR